MQRTEADINGKAPLKVKLGEREYDINPLTILKAREWRTLLTNTLNDIIKTFDAPTTAEGFSKTLTSALLAFPEKLAGLIFAYAPSLPQDEILSNATEEQLVVAYGKIMAIAFPCLEQLTKSIDLLKV